VNRPPSGRKSCLHLYSLGTTGLFCASPPSSPAALGVAGQRSAEWRLGQREPGSPGVKTKGFESVGRCGEAEGQDCYRSSRRHSPSQLASRARN
ncbi:unnamed protein product, partial [Ectocarpus sp. 12 AP-2014]